MVDRISAQNNLSSILHSKHLHKAYGFSQPGGTADEVSLSPFAKELSRVMGELENVSDVRQDRINDFKKQVEEGTYKPDPVKVARSLLMAGFLNGEE